MKQRSDQEMYLKASGLMGVRSVNLEASMTDQQYKDDCDANHIIKKYITTGEFTHKTSQVGQYADFTMITDYQDMLETVTYARDAFMTLPAEVRSKFQNDPGKLLTFLQDDKNYEEALKLGLVEKRKPKETTLEDVKNAINAKNTSTKKVSTKSAE